MRSSSRPHRPEPVGRRRAGARAGARRGGSVLDRGADRADDFAGHARIAAAARTPIQLGENWWGAHDMEKSVAARASDHAMFDAMKIGGVSGWLRAAALADGAGLPASSHAFPELSAQLLAVTPTCHLLEYSGSAGSIALEPLRIEDGHAVIPDRPGSGLEWDEDRLRATAAR